MATETYKLPWLQSTSDFANSQDVVALINGAQSVLAADKLMDVSSIQYDFPTDAVVEWWVVTHHQNGVDVLSSAHKTFTAKNLAALVAAVPGDAVFIKHNP
jgi:hypothetical protein